MLYIRVDYNGALFNPNYLTKTCHNINIILKLQEITTPVFMGKMKLDQTYVLTRLGILLLTQFMTQASGPHTFNTSSGYCAGEVNGLVKN